MKFHSKKKISNSYHLEDYDPSDTPSSQEYVLQDGLTVNHNGKPRWPHWTDQKNFLLFKKSDVFAKHFYDYGGDIALVAMNAVPAVVWFFVALLVSINYIPLALFIASLSALLGANALRLRKKYSTKKYYVEIADAVRFNGDHHKRIVLPDDDDDQGNNWILSTHFFEALKGDDSSTAVGAMKMLAIDNITEEAADALYATIYMIGEMQIKKKHEKLKEERQQAAIVSSVEEETNKYMAESLRDATSAKYTSYKRYNP